jgi:hypothetical protein
MNVPTDQVLYNRIKKSVYRQNPVHSAYRSGMLVQRYKRAFKAKHGSRSPYRSGGRSRGRPRSRSRQKSRSRRSRQKSRSRRSRSRGRSRQKSRSRRSRSKSRQSRSRSRSRQSRSRSGGLTRWFAERWRNQRGEVGYKYKSDVYRPTRRINKRTPTTFRELSPRRLSRARSQKRKTGRVKRF